MLLLNTRALGASRPLLMEFVQLMRDPSVLNACFCSSDTEAKALFSADNGYVARAVAKLKNAQNIPMDTIQVLYSCCSFC